MRLFVALELDPDLRRGLAQAAGDLAVTGGRVRWVAEERIHLTLRFLGEVPGSRAKDVTEAVREATHEQGCFPLRVRGLGTFPPPPRPPRVLWAGIEPEPRLESLAARLEQGLVGIGFAPERRPFAAHVTLARCQGRVLVRPPLDPRSPVFGEMTVRTVTLMESVRMAQGPEYTPLATLPLSG